MSKKYYSNFKIVNPEIKDYEIIDAETKGNVIRFYLGTVISGAMIGMIHLIIQAEFITNM